MKMILKLFAFTLLALIEFVCVLGNLLTNAISYVVGFLIIVLIGCGIYCVVQAMWTSPAILVGIGLAAMLLIFLLVWAVVKAQSLGAALGEFIRS